MKIELSLFYRVTPNQSHLKKLENLPPLKHNVTRRLIRPEMDYDEITGYIIHDFSGNKCRGVRYFSVEKLEKMSE